MLDIAGEWPSIHYLLFSFLMIDVDKEVLKIGIAVLKMPPAQTRHRLASQMALFPL